MAKAKQREQVVARIYDYQATFRSPEGIRVLRSLMAMTGFLRTNYVANDPHGTVYNEGARSVVVHILKQLKIDVKDLEKQLAEEYTDDDL